MKDSKENEAACKIQAAFRGYLVRKSLHSSFTPAHDNNIQTGLLSLNLDVNTISQGSTITTISEASAVSATFFQIMFQNNTTTWSSNLSIVIVTTSTISIIEYNIIFGHYIINTWTTTISQTIEISADLTDEEEVR